MRVLVTGAGGLLGSAFAAHGARAGLDVVGLTRADLDVTDAAAVSDAVRGSAVGTSAVDWVVHCAAYTAVDRAEAEPEAARSVNVEGARHVARAAAEAGVGMVHVSTDYVFDGPRRTPWRVGDRPGPRSVYARTKWAGERAVLRSWRTRAAWGAEPLVVRTGWLVGEGGRGFVRTIVDRAAACSPLRIVEDQTGRPTMAADLVRAITELMRLGAGGIWHVANAGEASWLDLAREALRLEGLETPIEGVTTAAWGAAAPRPSYSVLDLTRTERALGRPMRSWGEALAECLESASVGVASGAGGGQRARGGTATSGERR